MLPPDGVDGEMKNALGGCGVSTSVPASSGGKLWLWPAICGEPTPLFFDCSHWGICDSIFCMIIGLTKRKAPPGGLPNRAEPAFALISSKTTMIVSFSPCDVISKPRDGSRRLLTIRYSESAAGASTDFIAPLG